jgi:hypothetical protein
VVACIQQEKPKAKGNYMFYTMVVILLVLWVFGLVTSTTLGGFIHLLLAGAIVMMLLSLISRRKQA